VSGWDISRLKKTQERAHLDFSKKSFLIAAKFAKKTPKYAKNGKQCGAVGTVT